MKLFHSNLIIQLYVQRPPHNQSIVYEQNVKIKNFLSSPSWLRCLSHFFGLLRLLKVCYVCLQGLASDLVCRHTSRVSLSDWQLFFLKGLFSDLMSLIATIILRTQVHVHGSTRVCTCTGFKVALSLFALTPLYRYRTPTDWWIVHEFLTKISVQKDILH